MAIEKFKHRCKKCRELIFILKKSIAAFIIGLLKHILFWGIFMNRMKSTFLLGALILTSVTGQAFANSVFCIFDDSDYVLKKQCYDYSGNNCVSKDGGVLTQSKGLSILAKHINLKYYKINNIKYHGVPSGSDNVILGNTAEDQISYYVVDVGGIWPWDPTIEVNKVASKEECHRDGP